jgi:predicted transcriptional regulator
MEDDDVTDEDQQLRRESPAYRADNDWEVLEPQALDVVLSVRFDPASARRLARVAGATGRTPSRLIRDWILERLAMGTAESPLQSAGIRESATSYSAEDPGEYEELRQRYRPQRIELLLVGESRPAGGTFFYLANSNLYYATLEAWQKALGPLPSSESFLDRLKAEGVWLYDLSAAPVNRLRGRPRQEAVRDRTAELAELLAAERPQAVVVVKRSLAAPVREATQIAGLSPALLHVLPFPLYQWRAEYVARLADLLMRFLGDRGGASPTAAPSPTDMPAS